MNSLIWFACGMTCFGCYFLVRLFRKDDLNKMLDFLMIGIGLALVAGSYIYVYYKYVPDAPKPPTISVEVPKAKIESKTDPAKPEVKVGAPTPDKPADKPAPTPENK